MLKVFETCYHKDGLGESSQLSILAMASLVFVLVVGISYAMYLLVDAMGISNASGIHVTKNMMLAVEGAKGNLYSNTEKNIKDWIVYKNEFDGYEIKYPNDLESNKNASGAFELKKTIPGGDPKQSSLLYTFMFSRIDEDVSVNVETFMQKRYPEWTGTAKRDVFGGKEGLRTGVFKSVSGIYKDVVCWKNESKVLCLESKYYLENNADYVSIFDKVIAEVDIR
ncbi:MAG: hypothetical protein HGA36_00230 [Candidatus Moranbacteria bacterium]|nr:hypothetical protein [Candidatus Moranbacteria bacterium]